MGQYYKPIFLNDYGNPVKNWVYSHDYGNGLKLMEHSWMKNPMVNAVESLLAEGEPFHKSKIVWAGDYADGEPNSDGTEGRNLYSLCKDDTKIRPDEVEDMKYQYLINHTKMEYVDKLKVPEDKDGWRIHPLPLLTCEGNGQGGGDYRGDSEVIGSWARNNISASNTIPDGYRELVFDLVE